MTPRCPPARHIVNTREERRVRDVGISALRWRRRWITSLDELVSRLAGQTVAVNVLRRELADVCREIAA
jgi:hypothetical protein